MIGIYELAREVGFLYIQFETNPVDVEGIEVYICIGDNPLCVSFEVTRIVGEEEVTDQLFEEICCELRDMLIESGYLGPGGGCQNMMGYDWGPLKDWVELGQSLGEISDITIEVIDGVQRLSFYTNHGIKFFYLKPGGSFLKDLEQAVCEIRREAEEDGLV